MKMRFLLLLLMVTPALSLAAEGGIHLDKANIDPDNQQSLQRGAKLFVNYCLSCHPAAMMRYERMGKDLGIDEKLVAENLMFTGGRVGDLMTVATNPEDAKAWFGTAPPDLSVEARARGANWLYSYLKAFYLDPSRPTGVNNTVFHNVGMPDVLWDLEGLKKPVFETRKDAEGHDVKTVVGYEMVQPGKLSADEFDSDVRDLVNFLVYMGEPAQLERPYVGLWVLLFLAVMFVVSYYLKKEYWNDVH